MPEMDGYVLTAELKKKFKIIGQDLNEIKFVAVTAMDQSEQEMIDLGFDGLITKPIDPDGLDRWFNK